MSTPPRQDEWKSKIGVVLAVAGSAVGFGNFLRFPGLAAEYGGGAFMLAYFCSLLLVGIPLSWVEWSLGRYAGRKGFHSPVGAFQVIGKHPLWKYLGILSLLTSMALVMYYLYIEGWALGYAYHMIAGDLQLQGSEQYVRFFERFTGSCADGQAFQLDTSLVLVFFSLALMVNVILIYRGISKGIEWFSKWSMPVLIVLALIITARVLTLGTPDPNHPERSVSAGLAYMWNPDKVVLQVDGKTIQMLPANSSTQQQQVLLTKAQSKMPDQEVALVHISFIQGMSNPELWLAAVGQIFFSLSIGFGSILTYASYVRKNEDIALSSLTANSANEIVEVGISGIMTVPAAVCFLGISAAAGVSTFGLGFEVLPQVFAVMPAGRLFGFFFFGLLFLAAVSSSLSQIQPSVSFIEEYWNLSRKQSITLIAVLILVGSLIVMWFTGDRLIAMDTMDFFFGTLLLYLACLSLLLVYNVAWNRKAAEAELLEGALITPPKLVYFIMKWVTPSVLIFTFVAWLHQNIVGVLSRPVANVLEMKLGAIVPLIWVGIVTIFFIFVIRSTCKERPSTSTLRDEEDNQRPPVC